MYFKKYLFKVLFKVYIRGDNMESSAIRAIMIGTALFITMITISAVMLYFNSAKELVTNVGSGSPLSENYSTYIKDLVLTKGKVTGADIKNIINYFFEDESVEINISTRRNFSNKNVNEGINLPTEYTGVNTNEENYNTIMGQILDNSYFEVNYELYSGTEEIKKITIKEMI